MSSKKYVQKTSLTDETLEIRVFEAVCLNHRPEPPYFHVDFAALVPKVDDWMVAHVLVPIQAVVYAPRAPSVRGSFALNPKPMPL